MNPLFDDDEHLEAVKAFMERSKSSFSHLMQNPAMVAKYPNQLKPQSKPRAQRPTKLTFGPIRQGAPLPVYTMAPTHAILLNAWSLSGALHQGAPSQVRARGPAPGPQRQAAPSSLRPRFPESLRHGAPASLCQKASGSQRQTAPASLRQQLFAPVSQNAAPAKLPPCFEFVTVRPTNIKKMLVAVGNNTYFVIPNPITGKNLNDYFFQY